MTFKKFLRLQESRMVTHGDFFGKRGAGVLVYCSKTKRFLLGLRSDEVNEPGTWGIFGGAINDDSESFEDAAERELEEETRYSGKLVLYGFHEFRDIKSGFVYRTFLGVVPEQFIPKLDWENDAADWFSVNDFPKNLHFGVKDMLQKIKKLVVDNSI